ncbi:MAG: aminopeptidase [Sphaerochaetaceae bacterium]|jgi:aminopeptidase|nr:aminopeptidase [Sphaerochaetaceae bacterium]MDX9938574.1 aminopeptidase [Sphaerochaetaceae bacterium]
MKSIERMTKEYADLIVSSGVALYPGQCLQIKTGPENYWFAQEIAVAAYKRKALLVRIDIDDLLLVRTRLDNQEQEQLETVPDFAKAVDYEMMAKDWAYIRIDNTEDREYLADADAGKLSTYKSALGRSGAVYQRSRMRHEHPWCVVCAPGPKWARSVLGPDASVEDFWKLLAPILKLDREDPALAWKEHADTLLARGQRLDALQIRSLHFMSKETDLTIGFTEQHRWMGGGDPLPNGGWFIANIPTEEIFSTPDRLTAEGYVVTTRPVSVMDSRVERVKLTFKEGKVVACTAERGQEVMDRFLSVDEGARYLGEVALVDEDSPIALSKRVFNSILYDENASCHLALGAGYPSCLANAAELSTEEKLLAAGCNRSLVHTDFMVGSPDMTIEATTKDGSVVTIMREGRFTL